MPCTCCKPGISRPLRRLLWIAVGGLFGVVILMSQSSQHKQSLLATPPFQLAFVINHDCRHGYDAPLMSETGNTELQGRKPVLWAILVFFPLAMGETTRRKRPSPTAMMQLCCQSQAKPLRAQTMSYATLTTSLLHSNINFAYTGPYYYGYRYYDPNTGRWPSRDPMQERGGFNIYCFVGNQSVTTFDPIGLSHYSIDFGGPIGPALIGFVRGEYDSEGDSSHGGCVRKKASLTVGVGLGVGLELGVRIGGEELQTNIGISRIFDFADVRNTVSRKWCDCGGRSQGSVWDIEVLHLGQSGSAEFGANVLGFGVSFSADYDIDIGFTLEISAGSNQTKYTIKATGHDLVEYSYYVNVGEWHVGASQPKKLADGHYDGTPLFTYTTSS